MNVSYNVPAESTRGLTTRVCGFYCEIRVHKTSPANDKSTKSGIYVVRAWGTYRMFVNRYRQICTLRLTSLRVNWFLDRYEIGHICRAGLGDVPNARLRPPAPGVSALLHWSVCKTAGLQ